MRILSAALLLGLVALPAVSLSAAAETPVAVRVGDHAGFSRLVLDMPVPTAPAVQREGNRLSVRLPEGLSPDVAAARRRLPPGIAALSAESSTLVLELAPGAQLRQFRLGNRMVFDVLPAAGTAATPTPPTVQPPTVQPPTVQPLAADPPRPAVVAEPLPIPPVPPPPPEFLARLAPPPAPQPPPATPPPAAPPAAAPPPLPPLATPIPAPPAAQPPAAPEPANNLPLDQALPRPSTPPPGPVALAVRPAGDSAITLPFDARIGLALFRRGGSWWIVADEPRPLDLAALRRHPKFGAIELAVAPAATLLRVPLPPGQGLRARREGANWLVELIEQDAPPATPLRAAPAPEDPSRLVLPAGQVGRSVALRDPATGETLLVGSVRDAAQGIAPARAYAAFALPPTAAGILVVPQSDNVQLRALAEGFVVSAASAGGVGVPMAAAAGSADAAQVAAARLSRRFDFSAGSEAAQAERIRRLAFETGAAAPLARQRLRMETAQALLSLGMAAEAQGVLELAAADDPAAAREPKLAGLAAIAALVAGRAGETAALADPRLDGTDEIAMWRALRALALGQPEAAQAPVLAATAPLVGTYGAPLRRRLVPLLAEGMAAGGEPAAAERLLAGAGLEPELTALARGRIHAAKNEVGEALAAYDEAIAGRDRLRRAQALSAATELSLASGRIDAAEAAKRLDAALYAWRGDGMEIAQRMRIASLRLRANDPRGALATLRETASLFPEEEAAIRPQLAAAFETLFGEGAADSLTPLQAVTLFEDNVDLLPPGPRGEAMIARLADRLLQLDLPGRAASLVVRVMDAQAPGDARAALGAKLAAIRLADRDPQAARAALAASAADGLPPSLVRERRTLEARALAEAGDPAAALAVLGAQTDTPALELRAAIAAAAGDWAGAVPPLAALAAAQLPPPGGALDAAQRRTLLRLATAAALAGQNDLLARLGRERGEAMQAGPLSEPFRLLTADPLRGAADLPRMAAELQLARGLPQTLAAMTPR